MASFANGRYTYLPHPTLVGRQFFDEGSVSVWVTANGRVRMLMADNDGRSALFVMKPSRARAMVTRIRAGFGTALRVAGGDFHVYTYPDTPHTDLQWVAEDEEAGIVYDLFGLRLWDSELPHVTRLLEQAVRLCA